MRPWTYHDGDVPLSGEFFAPTAPANGYAILIAHEADGIGGNVRRHAARLAAEGYQVGAADLHGAGRPLTGDEIPPMLDGYRREPARLARRVGAALDALVVETGLPLTRLAAIGYCFGGWAVLELARSGAGLAAVASFHGLLTTAAPAGAGVVRTRVLACTGALDPLVPPADVAAFQAEMTAAGADWQLLVHGTARHSYTNETVDALGDPRMGYDEAAAELSWTVLLAHLTRAFASV